MTTRLTCWLALHGGQPSLQRVENLPASTANSRPKPAKAPDRRGKQPAALRQRAFVSTRALFAASTRAGHVNANAKSSTEHRAAAFYSFRAGDVALIPTKTDSGFRCFAAFNSSSMHETSDQLNNQSGA